MNEALRLLLAKATTSRPWRRVLNMVLWQTIPFNAPHRLTVTELSANAITVVLPYRRSNRNHVRGLHACALATAAEYASGLVLLQMLQSTDYRLLMKSLHMDYHYQGREDAVVRFSLPFEWIRAEVIDPLSAQDAVVVSVQAEVKDRSGNHLATARVAWQIKRWEAVGRPVSQ
ncbi:MAG: DUF4442 domain-containing protein [Bdellovibrionales bacterium]|nr:DUF4442 domain-containing protein [Bdellovibrionales bacterium]